MHPAMLIARLQRNQAENVMYAKGMPLPQAESA